jgi:hypothetical protein
MYVNGKKTGICAVLFETTDDAGLAQLANHNKELGG